jgi:mRNA interferase MazF
VYLKSSQRNGLKKESAADCFQVKSLSLERFESLMGVLTADEIEQISAAVALCVGAS